MAATADRKSDKNTALLDLDGDEREPFAAFVSDDITREAAARMAAKRGWPTAMVRRGGLAAAIRSVGVVEAPRAMIIDLSDMADAEDALDALAELTAADTRVIALGAENDVALFRRLLASGVADYLIKPVTAEALDGALARAEAAEQANASRPARRGRVIAFVGSRGGVGTSTLTANAAWVMASELERRTVLVDLDLQFGTLALTLDLDPGRGLREALEDPTRIDELFIDRAVHRIDDRLHALTAEEALDDNATFDSRAVSQMLDQLSERYHCVVVDLPRTLLGTAPDLLNAFTDVTVVSDLSLVGLRDANRLIRLAKASAPDARLRVVANRAGPGKKGQIAARDFERALEIPLKHSVPADDKAATKSANVGRPLVDVAGKSRLMLAVRQLAVDVAGRGKPKKKSLFSRKNARRRPSTAK